MRKMKSNVTLLSKINSSKQSTPTLSEAQQKICFDKTQQASCSQPVTQLACSSPMPIKLIHINQYHKPIFPAVPSHRLFNKIVLSQFNVAKTIKNHRYPILCESLTKNLQYTDSALPEPMKLMRKKAEKLFVSGFPNHFSELTRKQKQFLYDEGGVFTLFHLGEIHSIYKAIREEICNEIDKEIEKMLPGAASNQFNLEKLLVKVKEFSPIREEELINCVEETALKYFKNASDNYADITVIVVFGKHHDLAPICKNKGFNYELINTVEDNVPRSQLLKNFRKMLFKTRAPH